jgi:hypothetical protein
MLGGDLSADDPHRGASCTGIGCGFILLMLFLVLVCGTCAGTDWLRAF